MVDSGKRGSPVWLNAAESRLVASSRGAALASASVNELQRHVVRARAMRDKWRDVYMKQRRETQQVRAARASGANRRSREKSELFGKVLTRLEARLAKLLAAPAAVAGPRASKNQSKRTRTRTHRQDRTRTRRALADQVAERQSEVIRREHADLPPMQTRTVPSKRATRKTREKSRTPARSSLAPRNEKARSQSQSAAVRHRAKVSGLTTRMRGHVSGRGKRDQARRDRRR